ncbi:MAG TPA: VacB/RNase II family 3'-5' exoribonuclease [Thermoanaerobaculia bacterium]|nr:VacB/RNase II family 3'-5' exoribonuclease [Thermoanaerobaculia bacterium]HUM30050.1 VacB/RNase II family 3'-5' exoribonuclease [Thermoanaerobaculia bacterium]HXK68261.1 VacB/RNase II family 3'-5' exoribonuclease [Thermoanaerobaculia bacterium]
MKDSSLQGTLVSFLKKKGGKPVEISVLRRQFGKKVDGVLEELELTGIAVRIRRHVWAYGPFTRYRVGTIRIRAKRGELRLEDGSLTIPLKKAQGAMDGDLVLCLAERGDEGRVVRILRRNRETLPGFLVSEGKTILFRPFRRNLPDMIPRFEDGHPADGSIAFEGAIVFFPTATRQGRVKIGNSLGKFGERGMEARVLYADRGWTMEFPEEVLREAESSADRLSNIQLSDRTDLRGETIFTIDGEYARDFDDAISLSKIGPRRWRLGVHIADVSHFVRPGTSLDEEAFDRATSTYFPDTVVPMLPEALSNGVCSLRPEEDRLTLSVFMDVDERGRTSKVRLLPTIIRSRYRMTYTQVQAILDGRERHPLTDTLREMNRIAKRFHRKRVGLGSLDFDLPEVGILYDDQGRMVGVRPEIRFDSHRLIEEFMITANREVAKILTFKKIPFLYRIHEDPDKGKLLELKIILEGLGYPFRVNLEELTPLQVQRLQDSWEKRPEGPYLNELLLRSLARARYTPENVGHFGLALEYYCHFTSPIRRYPDLIVHRRVKEYLSGVQYDQKRADLAFDELVQAGDHCSKREWEAEDAEREVMEWKTLQIVKEKENQILSGRVSGVIETGIFIILEDYQVQGFLPFATYKKDYLTASTLRQEVSGRRTSLSLRLGDEVRVKILSVDLHKRYLRLEIV